VALRGNDHTAVHRRSQRHSEERQYSPALVALAPGSSAKDVHIHQRDKELYMAIADLPNIVTISWNPVDISLADLKILTAYVADIDDEAAQPWAINQLGSAPGSPLVIAIRMGSPLIAEITSHVDGTAGVLTLGAVGYFIKHPEVLGGWIARFRGASYRDRTQFLIEKSEYLRMKAEIEAYGEPILAFESAAESDLQMSLTPPESETESEPEAGM
jgi:hypothetical protein